jgi:NADH-quinone oxidoreductase subunit N
MSYYFFVLLFIKVVALTFFVYYYFKVIQAMYFKEGVAATNTPITGGFKIGLIVLAAIIIILGIFPTALLNYYYF